MPNVVAWFDTLSEAEMAVQRLALRGFSNREVWLFSGESGRGMNAALESMGVPDDHARTYTEFVDRGGSLVIVSSTEQRAEVANQVLHREPTPEQHIRAQVPETRTVELRSEKVILSRHTVDRLSTPLDPRLFKEETYTFIETDEVPVVSKEARIVEEIVVRKIAETRTEALVRELREEPDPHRFGSELRIEEEWSEIEPQAREEWEREHPGTWERFHETIRASWERSRTDQAKLI